MSENLNPNQTDALKNKTGFNIDPDVLIIVSNRNSDTNSLISTGSDEEKHEKKHLPSKAMMTQKNIKNKAQNINDNENGGVFVQILQISNERRINASVLTVAVKSDRNIGAMCRTCEIMGDNHIDMRSSVGSHNYLNFEKYKCDIYNETEVNTAFDSCMTKYQMNPVFIEQG